MSMKVLLLAEHDGNTLNPSTARALACANGLGGEVHVVVFAASAGDVANAAAQLEGVAKVLTVERTENGAPLAAVLAPQIAALADGYDAVLAPSTTFGKDVLPRAAALLGAPQVSDIMEVVDAGARTFRRPMYAGNAIVDVKVPEGVKIIGTVRTASFQGAADGTSAAPIEAVSVAAELPSHSEYVGLASQESERPDLQSAPRVVSGGRGVGSEENFKVIFSLADKLGAAVGASRAAVDAGYVPNDMQVGQTGKIIAPDLYLAIGISGAIQHVTGIKDAGIIVAINKDPEAPIFEIADYGLVGDLFKLLPELEEAIG
ncbi:MAG: electron transfer flavoprotein subunit alpha/FixB family protein [Pseudomonadota bacterium]